MITQSTLHILYTKVIKELPADVYENYLSRLSPELKARNIKYRRWQDRTANLVSKILLLKGLGKLGYNANCLEEISYNTYGRPYLPGGIDFNISHSGQYTLCALAPEIKVGIDIEEIKEVDFEHFSDLMTTNQWNIIRTSDDPVKAFFKFWTIKESIIKADGRGLSIPLNDIQIYLNDRLAHYQKTWYLQELNLDALYCTTVATDMEAPLIHTQLFDINKL